MSRRASPRHAGLMLSTDNRAFVVVGMVHLMFSGGWLLSGGSLLADGHLRPIGAHLFGVGFVLSLIYGLGAHMLPRFTGNPIRVGVISWLQWCALQAGLAGLVVGAWLPEARVAFAGGALIWLSFVIFASRLWPVLWPRAGAGTMHHG